MVNLRITKSSNVSYLFLGASNRIIYSLVIENLGDSKATCVRVKDILEENARIIPDTVKVNGCADDVLLCDMSISVGNIEPGGNSIITYEVEVSKKCIKSSIANKAVVSYCDNECGKSCNKFVEESNLLVVPIIDIDVKLKKSVDKVCAKVGEILSYTMIIRNDSNIILDDVVLNDKISSDLELYPASVLINGVPQYLENLNNINLGSLNPYSSIIVQFKGKVLRMPENNTIKNEATLTFEYTVLENGIEIESEGTACSNQVCTRILERYYCC